MRAILHDVKYLMPKETLYIYVRVSTAEQAEKDLSLPRQKELGIIQAKELGMNYKVFVEAGESASHENFDNRPQLFEILRLVKLGEIKHLFCFDQTRLSRNNITKAIISESLKKEKVNLYTHSKRFDFNKSEDELTFKILEAIETYESSLRKSRFKLGYITANKRKKYLKGIPPYGYTKDEEKVLIVDKEEKEIFLEIVDLYLNKGFGTNQIANHLNKRRVPTKTSKIFKNGYTLKNGVANRKRSDHVKINKWNPGTINTMLKNELYYGKRKFKIAEDKFEFVDCEPLIDKDKWDKIQRVRFSNAISPKKENKYFYLLKDILTCGNCGQPLHGRVKMDRRKENAYRCNSRRFPGSKCTSRGINKIKLNNIAWNAFRSSMFYHKLIDDKILLKIDDPKGEKTIKGLEDHLAELKKDLKQNETKMRRHAEQNLDSPMPQKMYSEMLSKIAVEGRQIEDNILICLANIKKLNALSKKKDNSKQSKGLSIYYGTVEDLDLIYPANTKENELLTRDYIRGAISGITVTYISEEKKHIVEVNFHDVGVKGNIVEKEANQNVNSKKQFFAVGEFEKVNQAVLALPKVTNEYFLNSDRKFRNAYEREKLKSTEKIGLQDSKNLPPIHVQQHR